MTFVLYESPATLKAEKEIADALLNSMRGVSRHEKLPMSYSLDFAFVDHRDTIKSYLECKWRPGLPFGKGGGFWLSLSKVIKANEIYQRTGLPCHLGIRPRNGVIYVASLFDHYPGSIWNGRRDRPDDDQALEPMVVYPWDAFEEVRG